jgi:hypothetical protein
MRGRLHELYFYSRICAVNFSSHAKVGGTIIDSCTLHAPEASDPDSPDMQGFGVIESIPIGSAASGPLQFMSAYGRIGARPPLPYIAYYFIAPPPSLKGFYGPLSFYGQIIRLLP